MQATLPQHEIVLLGAGHTNAHILRMWRMKRLPRTRLTCISNYPIATYSGMLPGVLAGNYPAERMQIDLVRLCASVGARLIVGEVTGVDVKERRILMAERAEIPFDALSIGIGSVPVQANVELDETVLAIKPMQTFLPRLESRLAKSLGSSHEGPLRVAVVGGGVAGIEVTLCLHQRLKTRLGSREFELHLITVAEDIGGDIRPRTRRRLRRELEARGVKVICNQRVKSVTKGIIQLGDSTHLPADIVLWTTNAAPPSLLANLDLPKDKRGFLLTRATLQTTADAPIFVVGDTGTNEDQPLPKAGVYAVRQGPILWENLARTLSRRPLVRFHPQRGFLKLINLGDGRAVAEYKGLTLSGGWAWKLKDRIDGRFMDKYQDYRAMDPRAEQRDREPAEWQVRCTGCGGKVSGSVLSQVLARLDVPKNEHVLLGLEQPDDAAVIAPINGRPFSVTADFFAAPLDDAYLSGRLAALNAASDIFALGGHPIAAVTLATIPVGHPRPQEQLLYELLAGSLYEFRRMGATLAGGHTIEGPQVTIGFTMLADQGERVRTKADLRAGDVLVLTKPLGTGVLLAAHMRAQCHASWMEELLKVMLLSNQSAAELAEEFEIAGLTDITGFGLAGHLLEMLRASRLMCHLDLAHVPLLPGVARLIEEGIESTLAPANRAVEDQIHASERLRAQANYRVLFDPQTSGGLLLGVRPARLDELLARLADQSNIPAAVIGTVSAAGESGPRIEVVSHDK